jgi:hypothetical protein
MSIVYTKFLTHIAIFPLIELTRRVTYKDVENNLVRKI